jgi:hypothetical protein
MPTQERGNERRELFHLHESNPVVLQRHHIVPRRYAGPDDDGNLVTLCANCHVALEHIYTDEVFAQLGRAWEDQQPDVGVSDILGILQSSPPPDLSLTGDTEATHVPFSFGTALAAAFHTVGEDVLKEALVTLWDEGQEGFRDDSDSAFRRSPSRTKRETSGGLPEGFD